MSVTIRRLPGRLPIVGPRFERRWIPDSADRARHETTVRTRLARQRVARPPRDEAPEQPAS